MKAKLPKMNLCKETTCPESLMQTLKKRKSKKAIQKIYWDSGKIKEIKNSKHQKERLFWLRMMGESQKMNLYKEVTFSESMMQILKERKYKKATPKIYWGSGRTKVTKNSRRKEKK